MHFSLEGFFFEFQATPTSNVHPTITLNQQPYWLEVNDCIYEFQKLKNQRTTDYLDGKSINMKREDKSTKAFCLSKQYQGLLNRVNQAYKLGRLEQHSLDSKDPVVVLSSIGDAETSSIVHTTWPEIPQHLLQTLTAVSDNQEKRFK